MQFLKDGISKIKNKITRTDLERKLKEATANEHCHANVVLLNEISGKTQNYNDFQVITAHCIKKLDCNKEKWRKILKDLFLIEHMLRTGSANFADAMNSAIYKLKNLNSFSYIDSNRTDKGETIREKSKAIVSLLEDSNKLREERENYAKWKNRIEAVGSDGKVSGSGAFSSTSNIYGSTSSSNYTGSVGSVSYVDKPWSSSTKDKKKDAPKEESSDSSENEEKKKKKKKAKKKEEPADEEDEKKDNTKKKNPEEEKKSNVKSTGSINIKKPGKSKQEVVTGKSANENLISLDEVISKPQQQRTFDDIFGPTIPTTEPKKITQSTNPSNTVFTDIFGPQTISQPMAHPVKQGNIDTFNLINLSQTTNQTAQAMSQQPMYEMNKKNATDELLRNLSTLNNSNQPQWNSTYSAQPMQPMNPGYKPFSQFDLTQPTQSHFTYNPPNTYSNPGISATFNLNTQQPKTQKPNLQNDDDFKEVEEEESYKISKATQSNTKGGGLSSLLDPKLVNLNDLKAPSSGASKQKQKYDYY